MLRLGGPEPHGRRSGVASLACDTDEDALDSARRLAVLLADQRRSARVVERDLSGYLPESARRAYDVHALVDGLLDDEDPHAGLRRCPAAPSRSTSSCTPSGRRNVVTTLGRLGGRTVGVIANNPLRLGGCLDAASAEKAARFVRMCDAFGVPLVVVVDVPGYLPGVTQEWDGVVRRGAKLLHAFAALLGAAGDPVTRKAFGGAYIAMNSRSLGATAVYAWPDAVVDVMGAEAAVGILHRRRLAGVPPEQRRELEAELAADPEGVGRAGPCRQPRRGGRGHRARPDPAGDRHRDRRGVPGPGGARQHPALRLGCRRERRRSASGFPIPPDERTASGVAAAIKRYRR